MENITKLYKEHQKLINDRAWKYSTQYGWEYEDAKSKAHEVFCRVVEDYDPDLSKFSSYLYNALRCLPDEMKKEKSLQNCTTSMDAMGPSEDEDGGTLHDIITDGTSFETDYCLLESAQSSLDSDSMLIWDGICNGMFEADQEKMSAPGLRRIESYVKNNWGWTRKRALLAIEGLKCWAYEEVLV